MNDDKQWWLYGTGYIVKDNKNVKCDTLENRQV